MNNISESVRNDKREIWTSQRVKAIMKYSQYSYTCTHVIKIQLIVMIHVSTFFAW